MADDTFNNDNQESLMGEDEFTEVEATVIEDGEEVEQEESLEAKINHGIGTLDINVGKVSETDFAREMRTSFLEYSMSVIVARALPDVRDGLKKQKTDKARKAYREKHESDFIIADAAVRYFRQKGITKLPTYKSLQAEIEQLTAEKNALYNEYRANKERVRELQTMKSNLSQMHHGEPSRQKKHEQER